MIYAFTSELSLLLVAAIFASSEVLAFVSEGVFSSQF